jgi:hypothetical protein
MVDFSFGFFGGRDRSANGWQRSEEEFFLMMAYASVRE